MGEVPESLRALLAELDSADPSRRDVAALQLREFAESAVDALLHAATRPANRNHRGTLVYALMAFNSKDRFSEIFDLALHGNYEVQCHAISILGSQSFSVTSQQLREAERSLVALRVREGLSAEDVDLLRAELQSILLRLTPGSDEHRC